MKPRLARISNRLLSGSVGLTTISILMGLAIGAAVLLVAGFNPVDAYVIIWNGIFSKPKYLAYVVIYATPLIITGLSVAFAFRTGLFNIGAEGQFIIGALVAALAGYLLKLPPVIHVVAVFALSVAAAALWGGFAGWLKARFGVHEVISTIMLNWISLYFSNYMLGQAFFSRQGEGKSHPILETARIDLFGEWKFTDAGRAFFTAHPVLDDIFKTPVNLGILFALVFALLVWYVLNKTTLGYELRAVGYNKDAAEYGGIDVKRSMIVSMAIAGGLSGAAGALQVMGVAQRVAKLAAMEGYGFDGMAVALIGNNTGGGSVFAGLLFGALKYGGGKIQDSLRAPTEVINIMMGTIVFFIAVPRLVSVLGNIRRKGGPR